MNEPNLNLNLVGTDELIEELVRRCPQVCFAASIPQGPGVPDRLLFRWSNNNYVVSAMAASMSRQINRHLDELLQSASLPVGAPAPALSWRSDIKPFSPPPTSGNSPQV
jgi:hypothetical protein